MDTNTFKFKFKIKDIDLEVIRNLVGLAEGQDTISVMTTVGKVSIPKDNSINLGIEWINELQLLRNNTLKITVSYPKYFNHNNGFEITTQSQISTVQDELIKVLEETFRAKVDVKNSKHTRIDFPINISNITDFREWNNVFQLIARATSDKDLTLYYGIDHKNKKQFTKGLLVSVSSDLDINFYDQRANLKRKTNEDIGKEVLRVETRYKKDYVIKSKFGTTDIKKIKLKQIREISRELIKNSVLDKLVLELQEQKDYITRELRQYMRTLDTNDTDKITKFIALYQTRIFDYEIVSLAIKDLKLPPRTTNKYRKQAREALQHIESISGMEITYFNNLARVNYLYYKLLGKDYKEFDVKELIN